MKYYKPQEYWSVYDNNGKKIADCGWEVDAERLAKYRKGTYRKNNTDLSGPVIDIEIPKALPTNEVVFAGNYEGPLYSPHPNLLKDKKLQLQQSDLQKVEFD